MPAPVSASVNADERWSSWSIAAAPVVACASTPTLSTAVSGETVTVPSPVTVIVPVTPPAVGGGSDGATGADCDRALAAPPAAASVAARATAIAAVVRPGRGMWMDMGADLLGSVLGEQGSDVGGWARGSR